MGSEWLGHFHRGDCVEVMRGLPAESVDLTVTSPPYDNVRTYTGEYSFDYPAVGRELLRVTKDGGVACVVIQDGTQDFAKSLTTARMQVAWVDAGWRLFECVIWRRFGVPGNHWAGRFRVDHEYVCVFFKGAKPARFDKSALQVRSISAGRMMHGNRRRPDGTAESMKRNLVADLKCPGTVWDISSQFRGDTLKAEHPAVFPERLAADLIQCFSRPGDIILDPYSGSGTTCLEAERLGRRWAGIDIGAEYVALSERRLERQRMQPALALDFASAPSAGGSR
jgi:site-specific DNA-methyltransferase (adenine-specific)